jgi:CAAX prenyl protease-like protein
VIDPAYFRFSRLRADPVIARCAPFGLFIGSLILGTALAAASLPNQWLVLVRSLLVAIALAWFWPAYAELRTGASSLRPLQWLVAVAIGLVVFLLWIVVDQDWAVLARGAGFRPIHPDGSIDWVIGVLRLCGFALVVPIMEEIFWRSFLLRWLHNHDFQSVDPRHVGLGALAITGVLFALEHNQWLASALAGLAYSWLYVRSGNLWLPVVAHTVTNAVLGIWVLTTRNWEFW